MVSNIQLSVPNINGNEWKYVKECLDTEWVSSAGKYVDLFEEKIAEFTGAKFAIACVNGTSALQISLRLAGVQPGDEVVVIGSQESDCIDANEVARRTGTVPHAVLCRMGSRIERFYEN